MPKTEDRPKSQRALAHYIDEPCRPDTCTTVQLIAQGCSAIDRAQLESLRKTIEQLESRSAVEFDVPNIDMAKIRIVDLSDASFQNASGTKIEIEYVIVIAD